MGSCGCLAECSAPVDRAELQGGLAAPGAKAPKCQQQVLRLAPVPALVPGQLAALRPQVAAPRPQKAAQQCPKTDAEEQQDQAPQPWQTGQ